MLPENAAPLLALAFANLLAWPRPPTSIDDEAVCRRERHRGVSQGYWFYAAKRQSAFADRFAVLAVGERCV